MSESPSHYSFPRPATPESGQHRPNWSRSKPTPARPSTAGYPHWDPRHRRWHNAALQIAGRRTIHAIRADETDSGDQRVAPACHTGHDRADDSHTLQPVYDRPVTCGSCRSYRVAHEQGQPYDPNRNQWMLPLGLPPMERFPPLDEPKDPTS